MGILKLVESVYTVDKGTALFEAEAELLRKCAETQQDCVMFFNAKKYRVFYDAMTELVKEVVPPVTVVEEK